MQPYCKVWPDNQTIHLYKHFVYCKVLSWRDTKHWRLNSTDLMSLNSSCSTGGPIQMYFWRNDLTIHWRRCELGKWLTPVVKCLEHFESVCGKEVWGARRSVLLIAVFFASCGDMFTRGYDTKPQHSFQSNSTNHI